MIIIFSNTKYPLFKRDLLNACCRNVGEMVVFSYRQKYVQPGLGNLNGQDALIVYLDYDPTADTYKYLPIRKVKIIHEQANTNGPILLKLRLGEMVKYHEDNTVNDQLTTAFHVEIESSQFSPKAPTQLSNLGVAQGAQGYFVASINTTTLKNFNGTVGDCWLDMCGYFGKKTKLSNSIFFRQEVSSLDLGSKSEKNEILRILSDKAYKLVFQVVVGDNIKGGNNYPEILTNDNISCHGPLASQYQGAIRADYSIVARSSLARINTSLTIKVKRDDGSVVSPEISHLIQIRPPRFFLYSVIGLLLLGILALNLKDHVTDDDLYYIGGGIYLEAKKWLTGIGILLLLLALF